MDARISYAPRPGGGSIAYSIIGTQTPGAPRIVISCGLLLGCYQLQFKRPEALSFLRPLSQRAQVLIFDPAGQGLSGGRPPWSEDGAADLDVVTAAAGWERYSLFGGFIDGPAVIAHAARRPEQVTNLILWCALSSIEVWRETSQGAALLNIAPRDPQLFLHAFTHAISGWSDHEGARWLMELHRDAPGFDATEFARQLLEMSADNVVDRVTARTLVMFRRDSAIVDLDHARSLVERIPGAELTLIDGESLIPYGDPVEPVLETIIECIRDGSVLMAAGEEAPTGSALALSLGLTDRQVEVLRILAGGHTNREIALELGISVHTVDRHISMVYRRIGARGRADATAFALRNGIA